MKIILSGSLSIDQIMNFDGLYEELIQPEKLHALSIAPLVQNFKRSRGGIAGNIAYSLALLGEKPVLYSSIGQESRVYMDDLAKLGVNTSHVHYSDLPTATFSVLTDKNDCQVGGFYPGAMSDASSLTLEKFKDEDILMVISAHDPAQMTIQAEECLKYGKRMVYDVGQQSLVLSKEDILVGLEAAEVLIVNDYEMGLLVKKTSLTQAEIVQQVNVAVVTLGEKGSQIFEKQNQWKPQSVPACQVSQVVDPTGAGDAFRAGFLYGYVRQWPVQKCVQLGSVIGAYAVEEHGTQEHSFEWEEVKQRYLSNYEMPLSESLSGFICK